MKRFLVVFALMGVAQLSLASYELALVVDYYGRKIDRYDPVNGIFLGSFGGNVLGNPTDISVDQVNGLAYVADFAANKTLVFNYSNGELVRAIDTGSTFWVTNASNGDIFAGSFGSTNTRRYSATGTLLQTINTAGIYVEGHAQTQDGGIWYLNGSSPNSLHRGTVGSTAISGSAWNLVGASNLPSYLSSQGSQLAAIEYISNTSHRLSTFTTSGATVLSEQSIVISTSASEGGGGTGFGHGGLVYGATSNGSGSTMHRWLPGNSFVTKFSMSQTVFAQGMVVIVAPEPGGLLALGFGAALLLRRRK